RNRDEAPHAYGADGRRGITWQRRYVFLAGVSSEPERDSDAVSEERDEALCLVFGEVESDPFVEREQEPVAVFVEVCCEERDTPSMHAAAMVFARSDELGRPAGCHCC